MITWFSRKKNQASNGTGTSSDDFVSLSSHELRSPLSIIKWYTEILLDGDAGPLTDDQRKYLTVIETSNQRAIDLVRSLLNVSRLDLGTFSILPQEVSFQELLTDATASVSEASSLKNITIAQEVASDLPKIALDKHLALLVIKQLLDNAITFSQKNSTISVIVSLVMPSTTIGGVMLTEKSILVTVADYGIGIPKKDQEKIFSKMFKASNVKDSDGTGSGLGLYTARSIMEQSGGKLWFVSEEGKGSTFYAAFSASGMPKKEGRTTLD